MAILEATEADFNTLTAKGAVLVDFYAVWCGPCRMLAPILEEVAQEKPALQVLRVNVDECPSLAERFQVTAIPTLVMLRDGKVTASSTGCLSKEELRLFTER